MKTLQKTLLALAAGSLMTAGAQAAITYGNGMNVQPYIGAKIGQYDPDEVDDSALSYGIYGGAKFTPNFGVEAEYLTTGEETSEENEFAKAEYEGEVYGLYATYEYPFVNTPIYAKGRLGFAKNEIEVNTKVKKPFVDGTTVVEKYTVDDSGIAGGLGLGYNFNSNASIEAAYEWYPSVDDEGDSIDVSGVTLGAKFKF